MKPIGSHQRFAGIPTAALCAAALLLVVGLADRWMRERIQQRLGQALPLQTKLDRIPQRVDDWLGKDESVDPRILQIGGFDDEWLSRTYRHSRERREIGLFIGYTGRPRITFAHRPDVCYAAHGWRETGRDAVRVTRLGLPAVVYEFASPEPPDRRLLVLGTYVVNGRYTGAPDELRRYHNRTPGLYGEQSAFLARIQLVIAAGPDRAADLEVLGGLLEGLLPGLESALPYMNVEDGP